MKPRTKKILNFALIFGTLAVVLLVGFNGQEMSGAIDALKAISIEWIVLCVLSYAGYVVLDSLGVYHFLHRQGYKMSMWYAMFVTITGAYYSNITPGATGGQPMQIYYMKKKNVPIGIGTSALTVKFFCFHIMLAAFGTVLWIIYKDYIAQQVGSSMWILVMGYVYNLLIVSFVVLMAVSKRLVRFLISLVIRIGVKIRLCKNPEGAMAKWMDVLETFHSSVMMITRRPVDLLVQMIFSALQLISLMLVTYFVYHAFHLSGTGFWQIITLGILLYTSAAYTPMPGASGAQEGVFALYFANVFPDGIRLMSLLLWRFFTYYLVLIVGAVVTTAYGFRSGAKKDPEATAAKDATLK